MILRMRRCSTGRRLPLLAMIALLAVGCSSDDDAAAAAPTAGGDALVDDAATAPERGDVAAEDVPSNASDATPAEDTASTDTASGADSDDDTTGAAPDGEALYQTYCGFCHGANGEGYLADNANALAQPDFLATASDEFLYQSIVFGRPGTPMSPWGASQGGPLDDTEVRAIVAFIRSWQSRPSVELTDRPAGSALRGESVYNAACVSCHGADGEGVTAVSLNNPWFHELASDGFIRYAIENGRAPYMQAFAGALTDQQLDDVVAYIRTWRQPVDAEPVPPFVPDLGAATLNPDGPAATFALREGRFAAAADVFAALTNGERLVLLDARPTADYLDAHLTGATSLPFYDIDDAAIAALPRDTFIITYCGCPHAVSGQAADALIAAGFTDVAVLDEGFYYWVEQGWPVTSGPERGTP
jgi:cytochrome c oxidase cbb3-type subunit III